MDILQGDYRSICACVFSQVMRLKINTLLDFMNVLVLKRNSHLKVRNSRIAHRKYIGMIVNSILLAKYFIL